MGDFTTHDYSGYSWTGMPCLGLLGEIQRRETGTSMMGPTEFLMIMAGNSPVLAFWIAATVLAAVMLQRRGGRAERFLVAGASVKLVSNLLTIPALAIVPWLIDTGYSVEFANSVTSGYGIFCKVVGMAGIICLVYAFWVKFKSVK